MQFTNEILVRGVIFILGVCGFFVAKHIRNHKTQNVPLVCPIGFDCNAVVHSDYSKFMGLPVEFMGMIYYAFLSVAYLASFFVPAMLSVHSLGFMILASFVAFLFSIYLIGVQIFVLKKGCSWCIVSAVISAVIFMFTMLNYDFGTLAGLFLK